MRITLLQRNLIWADPEANQRRTEEAMRIVPKSDLYLLPEMWSTGFATQPEGIAETAPYPSLEWMQRIADERDAAMAGSIAVKAEDGTYRNRFYFVRPHQESVYYDKHHLFSYGGEDKKYTAGNERVIVEWRGVKFLLQVCYDLRFPLWCRNSLKADGMAEYDCILYVASWPKSRVEAWRSLLVARAIENQCYVCGVNRVGMDPVSDYRGGSAIINPYGRRIKTALDNYESSITGDIDVEALRAFRQQFPVLADKD